MCSSINSIKLNDLYHGDVFFQKQPHKMVIRQTAVKLLSTIRRRNQKFSAARRKKNIFGASLNYFTVLCFKIRLGKDLNTNKIALT